MAASHMGSARPSAAQSARRQLPAGGRGAAAELWQNLLDWPGGLHHRLRGTQQRTPLYLEPRAGAISCSQHAARHCLYERQQSVWERMCPPTPSHRCVYIDRACCDRANGCCGTTASGLRLALMKTPWAEVLNVLTSRLLRRTWQETAPLQCSAPGNWPRNAGFTASSQPS